MSAPITEVPANTDVVQITEVPADAGEVPGNAGVVPANGGTVPANGNEVPLVNADAGVQTTEIPANTGVPNVIGHYLDSSVTFQVYFVNNLLGGAGNEDLRDELCELVTDVAFSFNVRYEELQLTYLDVCNNAHQSLSDPEDHATVRAYAGTTYVGTFHIPQVGQTWTETMRSTMFYWAHNMYPDENDPPLPNQVFQHVPGLYILPDLYTRERDF